MEELFELAVGLDGDGEHLAPTRPLKRSTMPLVCGVWGLVGGAAPSAAQALAKARGEAAAVVGQDMGDAEGESRGGFAQKGDGARLGLSSLTARWTERERRSMAT